ncbi:MAG: hypothetical protein KY462_13800 [Actinobacteria bacterium]|nr:hypothetical protein [Actinomycetota bacterium]
MEPVSRVTASVAFPRSIVPAEPPDEPGGLPKRLTTETRVPPRHTVRLHGLPVTLGPATGDGPEIEGHDVAQVVVRLHETALGDAIDRAQPILEGVVDSLSFQAQAALPVVGLDVLDVTPTLEVGQERDSHFVANPAALVTPKFLTGSMNFRWQEYPVPVPTLGPTREADDRLLLALWWYVKALAVPWVADRYLFLWIALEVLWERDGEKITAPYRVQGCDHEIEVCPECGNDVSSLVRGASLRAYLGDAAGVDEQDAREMWRLRQVVHGRNYFTRQRAAQIDAQVTRLRAAVLRLLKDAMGIPADVAPALLEVDGPVIGPSMWGMGRREITEADLALEAEQLEG